MIYSVTEAKNRLPELIRKAEAGETVTITRRGIAVVELVRKQDSPKKKRVFGGLDSESSFTIRIGHAHKTILKRG